jgi:hypothetical protein
MSTLPLSQVKESLYLALHNNAPLKALVQGIYDYVPPEAVFPYIVFDTVTLEPWGLLHPSAYIAQAHLDIYSRQGGQKQALQIASLIRAALHQKTISASGFDVSLVDVSAVESQIEPDGITAKVAVQVRVWMKESVV